MENIITKDTLAKDIVNLVADVPAGQQFGRDTLHLFVSPLFLKPMEALFDKNIATTSCGSGKERGILAGITCKLDNSLSPKNKELAQTLKISDTEFRIGSAIEPTTTKQQFEETLMAIVGRFEKQ